VISRPSFHLCRACACRRRDECNKGGIESDKRRTIRIRAANWISRDSQPSPYLPQIEEQRILKGCRDAQSRLNGRFL
jgi:hypothetical protein